MYLLLKLPLPLKQYINELEAYINHYSIFKQMEPAEVIYTNIVLVLMLLFIKWFIPFCRKYLTPKEIKRIGFNFAAAWVPSVKKQIADELNKLRTDC